ncbi:ABC transporter permease [Homoserinibacter sp. YIM 151385]|uniref:ABC transporter permease n=1 Tax=Homoserinibacter sp. YIM 151385 TaxID=2985506 RepID=UPI0022F032B7|nr:ABC transporter permease [Homoserinibacter sp. YIM 151385]WBU38971.1 ABC transporter permease [Homoserinibacter sp. YIM 151385]
MTAGPVAARPGPGVGPSRRRAAGRIAGAVGLRAISSVAVLWGAATAAFLAQAALPGDRATVIFNIRAGQAIERTPEELARINEQYGLQDPLLVQYGHYLGGLLRGDLGTSYQQYRPVADIIGEQLLPTLALTAATLVIAWLLMTVWVVLTAGRGRVLRALGSAVDTTAAGLPHYWLGVILLLVFSLGLGWFPVIGGSGPEGILLPALTLAIPLAGFMGQATRTEFERSLEQPFALTARMRGMGDAGVRLRHVLRHASLPAVALSGWALGATISGAVVVETVFSRAGIGRVLVTAVNTQDLPVVTGVVVLIAALYLLANLLVDLATQLIDPRLRGAA